MLSGTPSRLQRKGASMGVLVVVVAALGVLVAYHEAIDFVRTPVGICFE
jgi:hypothetical protein